MAHNNEHHVPFGGGYQFQHDFGGRRTRRPVCDYGSTMVQWLRHRGPNGEHSMARERDGFSWIINMVPPLGRPGKPGDSVPVKCLHSSLNKIKHPINVVKWTPEGRRLLTGSSSGEFTLWNGMAFNFETIMSAHESAIRSVAWSKADDWLISADHSGIVKYWQPNFNNVKAIQAHEDPIRELAFAPTDVKFCTASDDSTIKIWDFGTGVPEVTLSGHSWDVKCVDWHPDKGLLVSGSKDHLIKLWDPRNGRCLNSLRGHKNTIHKTKFGGRGGEAIASCARDNVARIFDLRMMRDIVLMKGHDRDITTLTWHPIHRNLLSTGAADGALYHYITSEPHPVDGKISTVPPWESTDPQNAPNWVIHPAHKVQYAHEQAIWSLDWHPLGHILASGSNDRVTRFWTRARPGEKDCFKDRYHLGDAAAKAHGAWTSKAARQQNREDDELEQDDPDALVDQNMPATQPVLPTLPGLTAVQSQSILSGNQSGFPGLGSAAPSMPAPSSSPHMPSVSPQQPNSTAMPGQNNFPGLNNMTDLSRFTDMYYNQYSQPPPTAPYGAAPAAYPTSTGANYSNPPAGLPTNLGSYPPNGAGYGASGPNYNYGTNPGVPQSASQPNPSFYGTSSNPPQFPPPPPGFFQQGATNPPFPPQPYPNYGAGFPANITAAPPDYRANAATDAGIRKREPLPSQKESLREEMRRGNYAAPR